MECENVKLIVENGIQVYEMSNSTIDFETIDFTEGEDRMKALYNQRNCVSATWDDFQKLPKLDGYVNNVKRVPKSFSKIKDKKDVTVDYRVIRGTSKGL